jgi:hypothetical protein
MPGMKSRLTMRDLLWLVAVAAVALTAMFWFVGYLRMVSHGD